MTRRAGRAQQQRRYVPERRRYGSKDTANELVQRVQRRERTDHLDALRLQKTAELAAREERAHGDPKARTIDSW